MNGKFIEKYGTTWGEMNQDTKMMVLVSEIFDLREEIDPLRSFCDKVKKHEFHLNIIKYVGSVIASGLILGMIAIFLRLIGG